MELSAQELRLGNLVSILGKERELIGITKRNGKNETALHYAEFKGIIPIKLMHLKPIPLTEEWLLKFHPNALDLSNSIFRIGRFKLIWKFSYEYWYVIDDMTGAYMTKIEFVHEWQNFWHIMNGEELTIKQK